MRLATKLRKRGFTTLADLLETLQVSPSSARVVLAQEFLDSLRVKDSPGMRSVGPRLRIANPKGQSNCLS